MSLVEHTPNPDQGAHDAMLRAQLGLLGTRVRIPDTARRHPGTTREGKVVAIFLTDTRPPVPMARVILEPRRPIAEWIGFLTELEEIP